MYGKMNALFELCVRVFLSTGISTITSVQTVDTFTTTASCTGTRPRTIILTCISQKEKNDTGTSGECQLKVSYQFLRPLLLLSLSIWKLTSLLKTPSAPGSAVCTITA